MTTHQLESEISFIKKIIDDSRQATLDNGKYYILWGVIVGIASILTYIGVKNNIDGNFINWVWMNCIIIGWVLTFIFMFKDRKKERNNTFAGKMIMHTWVGAGVTMAVIAFVGITTKVIPYDAICPIIAAIAGGANYISSRVQRSGFILAVAFGWWAGSALLFFMDGIEIMLVYGILLSLFSIIPGIVLYFRWKKELPIENMNEVKNA
jgi:hypothetical protein